MQRLRLRLGRELAFGEAWDTSLAFGAPVDAVHQLARHWLDDFELGAQPLFRLPCFTSAFGDAELCFVHLRSREVSALPLLLLHGYCGSLAEFEGTIEPLANPSDFGDNGTAAFHVVCPALPGFGLSGGRASSSEFAQACAALMQRLGYTRYVVHGSDLGATSALSLAALDSEHVAGLHVSALPAYPQADLAQLAELTSHEKSQLALLSELQNELTFQLPESPIEALAFALTRLADSPEQPEMAAWRDPLLTCLTLSWALSDASARNKFYRETRLAAALPTRVPLAMHAFPLDAPSLRRLAELRHRVVEWTDHEHGGPMPALEQPDVLVKSLRRFCQRLR